MDIWSLRASIYHILQNLLHSVIKREEFWIFLA